MNNRCTAIPSLPSFLTTKFVFNNYRTVPIRFLYVGLKNGQNGMVEYCPVFTTPHYSFTESISGKETDRMPAQNTSYGGYSALNKDICTEEEFMRLFESIKDHGYDWQSRPIFVFRHWSRPLPIGRWDVADGFHRLAVLAALGEKKIKVATLRYKHSIIKRSFNRVRSGDGS